MTALSVQTVPSLLLVARPLPSLLSVVIPLYNEDESVPLLRSAITESLSSLACPFELVLVDDGSTDSTLELLAQWASDDKRVRVLHLARNFGHQNAATAGLDHASGDAIVLMDADLQDPPAVIPEMLRKYCEGYDVIHARRLRREGDSILKRATAWLFYRIMRFLVYDRLTVDVGDFRMISRMTLNTLSAMKETHRFLRGMVVWLGYPEAVVLFERSHRVAGSTKYPLLRMMHFAWTAALSFSALPLRLSLTMGSIVFALGAS
jgi:dolichol-phosphate mannosyltransferase